MAVAYVPSYLEDRATFVKERHNGLYGPASFILSNFIIGLPYLCMSLFANSMPPLDTKSNNHSPNLLDLLQYCLLALQLSTNGASLLHVDHVAVPRPRCSRIPRRIDVVYLP
jgi:hypothetical protein